MTRPLTLVTDGYQPDHQQHSIRADLTAEHQADLDFLAAMVLAPADLAVAELRHAIINQDWDAAIAACRRMIPVGKFAGDRARQMEREG